MLQRDAERAKEVLSEVRDRYGTLVEPLTQDQLRTILFILGDTFPFQIMKMAAGYDEEAIRRELRILGNEQLKIQIGDYTFWFSPAFDYYEVRYSQRRPLPQPAAATT